MPEAENPRAKIGGNNAPPAAVLLKEKHKDIFERARKWIAKAKKVDLNPKVEADCAKLEDLFAEGRDIANDADRIREREKEPHLKAGQEIDGLFNGEIRDALGTDPKKGGLAQSIRQAAADRRLAITRAYQAEQDAAAARARKEADRLTEQAQSQEDRGRVKDADLTTAKADAADRHADNLAAQAAAPVAEASRARTAGGRSVSVDAKLTCNGVVRGELDLEQLRPYFDQDALVKAVNNALKMKAFTALKGAAIIEQAVGRVRG